MNFYMKRFIYKWFNSDVTTTYNPMTLFAGGEQGVWFDPSDLSTLFQDVAGKIPVTKDGDPVALMRDKSGNGNHATQTVSVANPIYRSSSAVKNLSFDGVDDGIKTGTITLGTDMDCFIAIRLDATPQDDAIIGDGGYKYLLALGGVGSVNTVAGNPTYAVNGNVVATTRAAVGAATGVGVWSIIEMRNADLSTWTAFALSIYPAFVMSISVAGVVLCPAQTPEIRTQIRQYLADKAGVTL